MTRECKADFGALVEYVSQYKISKNLTNDSYRDSLKQIHKCYFALIVWGSEIQHNEDRAFLKRPDCTDEILYRLTESISDLGASLFNWINGSYKTSRVMLRVGIENFVRAVSAIEDKSQLTEGSVRTLFEKARPLAIFNFTEEVKSAFDQIHSDYALLCEDIHTAAANNMEQLSSLAGLPVFKKTKAEQSREVFVRTAKNFNLILCITFNSQYHGMHHRNRENILHSMSSKSRPLVVLEEKQ
jgi:hypothetical protein